MASSRSGNNCSMFLVSVYLDETVLEIALILPVFKVLERLEESYSVLNPVLVGLISLEISAALFGSVLINLLATTLLPLLIFSDSFLIKLVSDMSEPRKVKYGEREKLFSLEPKANPIHGYKI